MPRYITIPTLPIKLNNPDTDSPTNPDGSIVGSVVASDVFKALFRDPRITQGVQGVHAGLDVFTAYDVRTQLVQALPGRTVKVTDDEHGILKVVASKPSTLSPVFINSPEGISFLRGIVDASDKAPEPRTYEDPPSQVTRTLPNALGR